ncbi:hypothetical protein [Lacticaseibacillus sharpeae]|uniref:Uncharacterized protein n=1 Tax=Lacticaseibacillus sharpeae JCM 1186 = DSM 20505 TaxID=1291052 RepID=A0A0R1ZKT2_9LACO|nr:hypothetical protein [Lacticaseibacillus sharpeae]KRM55575.1 hypothetical protein FC18_GL001192 [Lacticaseibacillus sharpeae JCM 1186 = DSM 20505]
MSFLDKMSKTLKDTANKVQQSDTYAKLTSDETKAKLRDAGDAVAHGVVTGAKKVKEGVDKGAQRYEEKHQ